MRLATHFQPIIERLANAVRAPRETFDREDLKQGDRRVVLEKGADGWSLPGKWPVRKPEVDQLVSVLSTLRSRFAGVTYSELALTRRMRFLNFRLRARSRRCSGTGGQRHRRGIQFQSQRRVVEVRARLDAVNS